MSDTPWSASVCYGAYLSSAKVGFVAVWKTAVELKHFKTASVDETMQSETIPNLVGGGLMRSESRLLSCARERRLA
jgi:hypothetical protein